MLDWIVDTMNAYGVLGIFFLILIENLFPPIPSELILTFGGFLTSHENSSLTYLQVVLSSTMGSLVGALILYKIGTFLNVGVLKKFLLDKRVRMLGFKEDELKKTLGFFNRWRGPAVFFGRLVPVVRSLISIPAGMTNMKLSTFTLYTFLGSLIWNSFLTHIGTVLGENWEMITVYTDRYSYAVWGIALVILIVYIFKKVSASKKE